jgi:hypothetical protein
VTTISQARLTAALCAKHDIEFSERRLRCRDDIKRVINFAARPVRTRARLCGKLTQSIKEFSQQTLEKMSRRARSHGTILKRLRSEFDSNLGSTPMKRQIAYLLSGAAAVLAVNAAQATPAAPSPLGAPQSYGELLEPVQNAQTAILADDIARAQQPKPLFQLAQFYHHHHHHGFFHHHHHHHGFFPGFGITVGPGFYAAPDCYIQRRVYINRWGERVIRRVRVCD